MLPFVQSKKTYTLGFRITDEMRAKLEKLAMRKTRSIGQQAEHLLKMAIELVEQTDEEDTNRVINSLVKTRGKKEK